MVYCIVDPADNPAKEPFHVHCDSKEAFRLALSGKHSGESVDVNGGVIMCHRGGRAAAVAAV